MSDKDPCPGCPSQIVHDVQHDGEGEPIGLFEWWETPEGENFLRDPAALAILRELFKK